MPKIGLVAFTFTVGIALAGASYAAIIMPGVSGADDKITLICQGTMSFVNPIVGTAVKPQSMSA